MLGLQEAGEYLPARGQSLGIRPNIEGQFVLYSLRIGYMAASGKVRPFLGIYGLGYSGQFWGVKVLGAPRRIPWGDTLGDPLGGFT